MYVYKDAKNMTQIKRAFFSDICRLFIHICDIVLPNKLLKRARTNVGPAAKLALYYILGQGSQDLESL